MEMEISEISAMALPDNRRRIRGDLSELMERKMGRSRSLLYYSIYKGLEHKIKPDKASWGAENRLTEEIAEDVADGVGDEIKDEVEDMKKILVARNYNGLLDGCKRQIMGNMIRNAHLNAHLH